MSNDDNPRIQELFLAALEVPAEQRDSWLAEQCGDDNELLNQVRSLLEHDSPDDDPLEKGLEEALQEMPSTVVPSSRAGGELGRSDVAQVDSEHFISKLSEVGVLSAEELEALNQTVASGQSSANPRQIASQLVSQGKLTDYQATALLKGQPELLIDKYLILDLLDAGGMGMVFKAIHRPMNRTVAVKMIAQHLLASPEQVKRFQREVRVAATLEHPNIVRSYDADRSGGVHFLVMEYVRGENLTKIVQREGPMSVEMAVDCIRQAAKGLRYAQKKGVIHRDIKPGNLMLGDETTVKVLDLGLANIDESFRMAQQTSSTGDEESPSAQSLAGSELTTAGAVLGTVSFMAPEQSLDARKADTRADIYSLGCTLYYLLVGEAPYKGETIFQVFMLHREGEIPSLRDKRPDVPEQVEAVCRKMLAKSPEERYQSMGELLSAIEDCDIAPPPEMGTRSVSKGQTHAGVAPSGSRIGSTVSMASEQQAASHSGGPSLTLRVTMAIALLLVLGGYWWWQNNANQDDPPTQISDATATDDDEATPVAQPVAAATPQYALSFDGNGDYVELPFFGYDGKSPVTIEVWYKSPAPQWPFVELISIDGLVKIESVTDPAGWWLKGHSSENEFDVAYSEQSLRADVRSHLCMTFDGKVVSVFVDGERQEVELSRGTIGASNPRPSDEFTLSVEHRFGTSGYSIIGGAFPRDMSTFTGTIDEVRISTLARYTEDFTPADRFEADGDTLALYHFDEGEGDALTDSSGNGHHGKIVGARWVQLNDSPAPSEPHILALLGLSDEWEWTEPFDVPIQVIDEEIKDWSFSPTRFVTSIGPSKSQGQGSTDCWVADLRLDDSAVIEFRPLGVPPNSKESENDPHLSPDGKQLLFWSGRDGRPKIWSSKRNTVADPFSQPSPLHGPISSSGYAQSATMSADGLQIVFTSTRQGGFQGNYDLWIGERSNVNERFDEPINLRRVINTASDEVYPRLIAQDRGLLFSSNRETSKHDIYLCWRPSRNDPFGPPKRLDTRFNSELFEGASWLLPDNKTFVFLRERRYWISHLVRKNPTSLESQIVDDGAHKTNMSAADLLATGEYQWQVEQLTDNIPVHSGADLSADELTLVFASFNQSIKKNDGFGKADLWMTTRDSKEAEWSKPVNLGDQINTEMEEVHPALSADGLSLLYTRLMHEDRRETWISTRSSTTAPWSRPERFEFDSYVAPDLAGDQRSVVVSFGAGNLNIARRSASDAEWSNPVPVGPPINSDLHEDCGSISEDGRLLVFARDSRDGIERKEKTQIWIATRADWNAPWSEPIAISNSWELPVVGHPRLLHDRKAILFTGSEHLGAGNRNVYLARLVRKPASTDKR